MLQTTSARSRGADLEPAGLNLCQVQEVVDQFEQHLPARQDVLGVAAEFGVVLDGRGIAQDLGEADDRVQRRAEFVAHGCDELGLDLVGLEQGDVGFGEFVEFGVAGFGGGPQVRLGLREFVEHVVESLAEHLEFVAGVDLAADLEVPFADAVGHVLQVLDRPHHHVAEEGMEDDRRDDDDQERCRKENEPVSQKRGVALLDVKFHDDGPDEFVLSVLSLVTVEALALPATEDLCIEKRLADGPPEARLFGVVQEDADGFGLEGGQQRGDLLTLVRLGRCDPDQPRRLLALGFAEAFEQLGAFGGKLPGLVRRLGAGRLLGGSRRHRKGDGVDVLEIRTGRRAGTVGVAETRGALHLPPRPPETRGGGQENQHPEDEAALALERGS